MTHNGANRGASGRLPGRSGRGLLMGAALVLAAAHVWIAAATAAEPGGRVLRVGPDAEFTRPSQAARAAQDGDLILIQAGRYEGDVAVWRADRVTIRGVGGPVVLDAAGRSAQGKAIWVIKSDEAVVDSIIFTGAEVPDENGAGIRAEGRNLTVRNSVFHHNQIGLLTNNDSQNRLTVVGSEFYANGTAPGALAGHNIYVGRIDRFTLRASYFHHAIRGHQVKTRARYNRIQYNRITDEEESHGSYLIDISNGGQAIIMGNVLRQNERAENRRLISFGAEGARENSSFAVVHNTVINAASGGVFVANRADAAGVVANNVLVGRATLLEGPGRTAGNVEASPGDFVDLQALDVALVPGAAAIDKGVSLSLRPRSEYVHPRGRRDRRIVGVPDAGAYEYVPER